MKRINRVVVANLIATKIREAGIHGLSMEDIFPFEEAVGEINELLHVFSQCQGYDVFTCQSFDLIGNEAHNCCGFILSISTKYGYVDLINWTKDQVKLVRDEETNEFGVYEYCKYDAELIYDAVREIIEADL